MKIKLTLLAGVAALGALATACSSTPSTPATITGTETWQATETGAAVVGTGPPVYHLQFTGPVKATAAWAPPNNKATKATVTFKTTAGNLTVDASIPGNGNPPTTNNTKTCLFTQTITGTYEVVGSKSTGSFKNAIGHGTIKDVFSAYGPRLSDGVCNQSQNVQPLAAGAYTTLYVSGPMTVTS